MTSMKQLSAFRMRMAIRVPVCNVSPGRDKPSRWRRDSSKYMRTARYRQMADSSAVITCVRQCAV